MEQKVESTDTVEASRVNGGRRTTLHDDVQSSQVDVSSDQSEKSSNIKAYEISQEET